MTVPSSELVSPSLQPVSNPPDMSRWNPFGEDNFSKLTEEELLDREFDLLRASKCYKLILFLMYIRAMHFAIGINCNIAQKKVSV